MRISIEGKPPAYKITVRQDGKPDTVLTAKTMKAAHKKCEKI